MLYLNHFLRMQNCHIVLIKRNITCFQWLSLGQHNSISHSVGSSRANSLPRPTSPSPSVASEKTEVDLQEKQEREEEERKRRIQLYVFISRCIAYPFNAKQPTDMTRRQTKITKHQLETITARFQVLAGETGTGSRPFRHSDAVLIRLGDVLLWLEFLKIGKELI